MKSHRRMSLPFVAALLLLAPSLGAQQITGRVTNSQTGASLAAVQVFIAGSGIGALSQQNGRYLLLNGPVGTHAHGPADRVQRADGGDHGGGW